MTVTKEKINDAIAHLGYEIKEGDNGYFYFLPKNKSEFLWEQSIKVDNLNCFSLKRWVFELYQKIDKTNYLSDRDEFPQAVLVSALYSPAKTKFTYKEAGRHCRC